MSRADWPMKCRTLCPCSKKRVVKVPMSQRKAIAPKPAPNPTTMEKNNIKASSEVRIRRMSFLIFALIPIFPFKNRTFADVLRTHFYKVVYFFLMRQFQREVFEWGCYTLSEVSIIVVINLCVLYQINLILL